MEGRCSLLAWFLVIIAVTSAQSPPLNAKSSPELSRALLRLQRLLLALTFEDLSLQQGAFMSNYTRPGGLVTPSPTRVFSALFYDEVEAYEDGDPVMFADYNIDENIPVELPKAAACVESVCPSFNCSSDDPEVVKIVKAMPAMAVFSDIRFACNKKYIFSQTEMTYEEAGLACCKENMSLVSIESGQEYSCLMSLYPLEREKGSSFWTSGLYLTCPNSYRWCGSMMRFQGVATWKKGELDPPGECVFASFNNESLTLAFEDTHCLIKQKFICESDTQDEVDKRNAELKALETVNCKKPNCPEFPCIKASTTPYLTFDEACGKRYVLMTQKRRNFVRAQMDCCELGMRLLSVESRQEQICLEQLYSRRIPNNAQIWTSGTDLGCEGRYAWCGSNSSIKAADGLVWMDGEPNNFLAEEDCLSLWNYNGQLKLNDELCIQDYIFVCEEYSNATVVDNGGPDLVTIRTTRTLPPTTEAFNLEKIGF